MKCTLALLALASSVSALITRDAGCCFGLQAYAYSGPKGSVDQLSDGQNRIGQTDLSAGHYCIKNGGLTDSYGRGCILTPPTTQWQCDAGAKPSPGFSLSCNGTLVHDGSTTFWSCPTGDHGGWNIYSQPLAGEPHCIPIWLHADNKHCSSGCPPPKPPVSTSSASTSSISSKSSSTASTSSTASISSSSVWTSSSSITSTSSSSSFTSSVETSSSSTTPSSSVSTSSTTSVWTASTSTTPPSSTVSISTSTTIKTFTAPPPKATCPMELNGNWEFPHLIIPINSHKPNMAYGNKLNGSAHDSMSSIFNFDIPASDAGKTCSLKFLFPTQAMLETSAYTFSGNGSMQFTMLKGPATEDTTYANAPTTQTNFGTFTLAPGNAYSIADFACPAGQAIGVWMSAVGNTALNYFQDFNPCPIGLYITVA